MTDRNLADLDLTLQKLAQQFIDACKAVGIRAGISQTYRSSAEQDADYAQGRTMPGVIITGAKGGQSPHNCTLPDGTPAARAFDFYILNEDGSGCDWNPADPNWKQVIAIGENLGLRSGSTFPIRDNDHMELPDWQTAN